MAELSRQYSKLEQRHSGLSGKESLEQGLIEKQQHQRQDRRMSENVRLARKPRHSRKRDGNSYQIKGAHDKSYLDLSLLRLTQKDDDTSDTDSDRLEYGMPSSQALATSTVHLHLDAGWSDTYSGDISRKSDEESQLKGRKIHKFLLQNPSPKIFNGTYVRKDISITELELETEDIRPGYTSSDFLHSRSVSAISDEKPNYKMVVESQKLKKLTMNRKGYYSEVVSPFLRPERILAERKKIMEEMGQGEREDVSEEEGEVEEIGTEGNNLSFMYIISLLENRC